ncbi:MAG: hypothetical protein QM734_17355 [Cyclobacteriaceae bacterium]
MEGIYAQVISCINQTSALRILVDIPSGLFADFKSKGENCQRDFFHYFFSVTKAELSVS